MLQPAFTNPHDRIDKLTTDYENLNYLNNQSEALAPPW